MTRLITFEVPEEAALNLIEDVLDRYGSTGLWLVSAKRVENEYVPLTDEADDDDVDPDMVLTILQGAASRMADKPGAAQLDELIHALQAPEPEQRREELAHPKFQVKPTDTTPAAQAIKRTVIREIACPRCGVPAGKACESPTHQDYGAGHVHADRINAWQAM